MSRDDISRSTSAKWSRSRSASPASKELVPNRSAPPISHPSATQASRIKVGTRWRRMAVLLGEARARRREDPRAMAVPATNVAQSMNLEGVTGGGRVGVTRGEDAPRVSLSSDDRRVAAPGGNPLDPLELPARDNDGVIEVVDRGAHRSEEHTSELQSQSN